MARVRGLDGLFVSKTPLLLTFALLLSLSCLVSVVACDDPLVPNCLLDCPDVECPGPSSEFSSSSSAYAAPRKAMLFDIPQTSLGFITELAGGLSCVYDGCNWNYVCDAGGAPACFGGALVCCGADKIADEAKCECKDAPPPPPPTCDPACEYSWNIDCNAEYWNECGDSCGYGSACSDSLRVCDSAAGCICGTGTTEVGGVCIESSCDNGVDDDADGNVDERDTNCPFTLSLSPAANYDRLRPSVMASLSATGGMSPSGTKRICGYEGCRVNGECVNQNPYADASGRTSFCMMNTTQTTCSFTDTTLIASADYIYAACFGANKAQASLSTRVAHCADTALHATMPPRDEKIAPRSYVHLHDGAGWQSLFCDASTKATNECRTVPALCDGTSLSIVNGQPNVTCHASNTGVWRWESGPLSFAEETNCTDTYDNDCDGLTDGADSDCVFAANVTGFVWDAEPYNCPSSIRGAPVSIVAPPQGYLNATAGDCSYTIHGVPAGVRSVSAQQVGYQSVTFGAVNLPSGATVSLNFTLSNGSCAGCVGWDGRCSVACSGAPQCVVAVPSVCDDALPDSWVLDSASGDYVYCCAGGQKKTAISSGYSIIGCDGMRDLVTFSRVVSYLGQPVTLKTYVWRPCES